MFKPKVDKDWFLEKVALENDGFINAGGTRSEMFGGEAFESISHHHTQRKAFAKLVELSRRKLNLTQMQLAEKINVDPTIIIEIEDGSVESVETNTVLALAQVFNVPQQALMVLAGLKLERDKRLVDEGIRFIACSQVKPLQPEEENALDAYIKILANSYPQERKRVHV